MNVEAQKMIDDLRREIVKRFALTNKVQTRHNNIYKNDQIVLIQNQTTGDLKIKRNLR